ncbi:CDP-archaeol synthase [bacterium]|nr:MAG: CDP-archaeol synthase [bacterium]
MTFAIHLLSYTVPCWLINVTLNLWYLLKMRYPKILKYDAALDLNKNFFDGYRILGNSTTWVGLPIALLSGAIIESFLSTPEIGLLKGLAVYAGHALGSFTKRRFNIPRGQYVPIVDHGDSIILTGIIFYALGLESLSIVVAGVILTLIAQPIMAYSGYKLKLRDNPL